MTFIVFLRTNNKFVFAMEYEECTLQNGIRIVYKKISSNVAYCGYAIDAGTRDELPKESGMAHFVEHLSFKGTTHRKAWQILNRMENVGGDLNAFTNKEETIYCCTMPAEHTSRAVDILTDIVFHSNFPQIEINKEVDVIIDEIKSYEDSPDDLIFDDFEEILFDGHSLGRNILGKAEALQEYKTEDAMAFTQRYYQPGNSVFFYMGNFDFKKLVNIIRKATSDLIQTKQLHYRTAPANYVAKNIVRTKDTHQAHVIIGSRAYKSLDNRNVALTLLNNILGGPGMNSRLNVALREKRGLVYGVESNLTFYTDAGEFSVYFGTDHTDIHHCIDLTLKELKRLRDIPLTVRQLQLAKKQIIGQMIVAEDSFDINAAEMGKSLLHYNRYDSLEKMTQRINTLTPEDLQTVAKEIFDEDKLSLLIYK